MTKLLSVLVPTYNNYELFLRVVEKYLFDLRIIILVSDDSDDYIEKKSIQLFCKNNNIIYFNGPKKSAVENWNYLIGKTTTPFFVVNHHDEYPDNLYFLDSLDPKNTDLVILPCSSKVGKYPLVKMFSWQQKYFSKICLLWPNGTLNMILAPTASIIVNSKYKNILFDIKLKWFVDSYWYYKLFIQSIKERNKIKFFSHSRINSFQAENSITNSLKSKLKIQIKKEKDYFRYKGLLPNKNIRFFQLIILIVITFRSKFKNKLSRFIFF